MLPTSKRIEHTYEDFAEEAATLERQQRPWSHGPPGPNDPFPVQLHWMLDQTEKNGIPHVVSWAPHGRAFVVHQRDQFVKEVLPIYFNQTKITSFQRQLSLYGFKRITKGPDSGGYYHPKFLRISRTYARNIVRTKVKNDGPRKAASPDHEPDLYSMPKLPLIAKAGETAMVTDAVVKETSIPVTIARTSATAVEEQAMLLARGLLDDETHQLPTMSIQPRPSITPSLPDVPRLFAAAATATRRVSAPAPVPVPAPVTAGIGASAALQNRILAQQLIDRQQQQQQQQQQPHNSLLLGHRTRSWPSLADLATTRTTPTTNTTASLTASSSPTWFRTSPTPSSSTTIAAINELLAPPMPQLARIATAATAPNQTTATVTSREREILGNALLARGRLSTNSTLHDAVVSELLARQQQRSHSFPPLRPGSSTTSSANSNTNSSTLHPHFSAFPPL